MQSLQPPPIKASSPQTSNRPGASENANNRPLNKWRERRADKILVGLFCGLLVALGLATCLAPPEQISEDENRTLAPAPKLSKLRWRSLIPVPQQFEAY